MTMNLEIISAIDALIKKGDFDKAEVVLDKCVEIMPHEAIPTTISTCHWLKDIIELEKQKKLEKLLVF